MELRVWKWVSQSNVVFSVSGTVELYPSIRKQKDRGSRRTSVPGKHNVKENPLVDMNKELLPALYIKLDLMKNFMKALDINGAAF